MSAESPMNSVMHHGKQDNVSLSTKSINPTSTQQSKGFVFAISRSCLRSSFRLTESVAVLSSQKNMSFSKHTSPQLWNLCRDANRYNYVRSLISEGAEATLPFSMLWESPVQSSFFAVLDKEMRFRSAGKERHWLYFYDSSVTFYKKS